MTTANLTGTITVTRAQRDALRHAVAVRLDGDAIRLDGRDTTDTALQRRREFEESFAILDCLGWNEDDERDEFELPVDDNLRSVLKREGHGAAAYVTDCALSLESARTRDDELWPEETWESRQQQAQGNFDEALAELYAINQVSRRLWWHDRGQDRT